MSAYAVAFALTCLIELPVYAGWLVRGFGVSARRALAAALLANVVTHPALWLATREWADELGYAATFLAGEALVCLVEWAILAYAVRHRVSRREVALVVCCANGASAAAGLVLAVLRLG